MASFGIIAEGETDHPVISNILRGKFPDAEVRQVQPEPGQPGGWTLVFDALRQGKHRAALQFNDYLVIQVDTDVCDDIGFDVTKNQSTLASLIVAVRFRLIAAMGPGFDAYAHRVFFAVAVDSTECWLLPLLHTRKPKSPKITGCEGTVNRLLRKANREPLNKDPARYRDESAPYRKSKILQSKGRQDPSLAAFLDSLPAE